MPKSAENPLYKIAAQLGRRLATTQHDLRSLKKLVEELDRVAQKAEDRFSAGYATALLDETRAAINLKGSARRPDLSPKERVEWIVEEVAHLGDIEDRDVARVASALVAGEIEWTIKNTGTPDTSFSSYVKGETVLAISKLPQARQQILLSEIAELHPEISIILQDAARELERGSSTIARRLERGTNH